MSGATVAAPVLLHPGLEDVAVALAALVLPKLAHLLHVEPVVAEAEAAHSSELPTHAVPA